MGSKYRIRTFNKIAQNGLKLLTADQYQVGPEYKKPDAIVLRSHKLGPCDLNSELLAIARAGAGVNNIPVKECTQRGIVVFNAPGANANSVKELVVCSLLLSARDITGGVEFVRQLSQDLTHEAYSKKVEFAKKKFAGRELSGRVLGVVGLGAIGSIVATAAVSLGMRVLGFDPYLTPPALNRLTGQVGIVDDIQELFSQSEFISLHVPAEKINENLVNAELLSVCQPSTVLVNYARSEIVDSGAVIDAISKGKLSKYFVDFPKSEYANQPGIFVTPHLGASTEEAETNCAVMAISQLMSFLADGNIRNAVNFPHVSLERSEHYRLAVTNWNLPGILSMVLSILAREGVNVVDMTNRSRGEVAYNLMDLDKDPSDGVLDELRSVHNLINVRVLGHPT